MWAKYDSSRGRGIVTSGLQVFTFLVLMSKINSLLALTLGVREVRVAYLIETRNRRTLPSTLGVHVVRRAY